MPTIVLDSVYFTVLFHFLQEWTDYDEKAGVSVSIMEVQCQFIKAHK